MTRAVTHPIIDLHCDLLCYLADEPEGHAWKREEIGCAVPCLEAGGVRLQVLAAYTATESGSAAYVQTQLRFFETLLREHADTFTRVGDADGLEAALRGDRVGVVLSIENASGLVEEDEPLEKAFRRLDRITEQTRVFYVSLTHHEENRFGGGNMSTVGLKDDGRAFLDFVSGRKIAIDLAHTSDALARGIFEYIDRAGLDIPLLASHSNFRAVREHPRNLPDDIAREIIRRGGVIGLNFLREFIGPEDPALLAAHLRHALELGAERALCFGADYFCTLQRTEEERRPFYFPEHEDAGRYPAILAGLENELTPARIEGLAWRNAAAFIEQSWR